MGRRWCEHLPNDAYLFDPRTPHHTTKAGEKQTLRVPLQYPKSTEVPMRRYCCADESESAIELWCSSDCKTKRGVRRGGLE